MAVSDSEGLRSGVFALDNALCMAALDGTFGVVALADRDGLGSWLPFFLDPPLRTVAGLTVGLAGDGSREGLGEAVPDDVCELVNFFVPGVGGREGLRLRFGAVAD